jgi:hypothetical protein
MPPQTRSLTSYLHYKASEKLIEASMGTSIAKLISFENLFGKPLVVLLEQGQRHSRNCAG